MWIHHANDGAGEISLIAILIPLIVFLDLERKNYFNLSISESLAIYFFKANINVCHAVINLVNITALIELYRSKIHWV